MHRLQDQDLEHEDMIEGRPTALAAIRARHRLFERGPEHREIDEPLQPFEVVALGRQILQPLADIEKTSQTSHRRNPNQQHAD